MRSTSLQLDDRLVQHVVSKPLLGRERAWASRSKGEPWTEVQRLGLQDPQLRSKPAVAVASRHDAPVDELSEPVDMLSRGRLRFGQASVSALRVGLAYARVRGREGLRETLLECLHFPHPPLLEEAAERASGFGRLREADASTRRNVQAMGHEQRLGSMERLGQSIGAAVDEVVYLDTHSLDDDELGHRQAIRTRQPYRRCYWHHGRLVHANQLRRFQASSIENQAFPIHFPRSKPFLGLQVDSDVPSSFNLSASKTNTHIVRCHRFFFFSLPAKSTSE